MNLNLVKTTITIDSKPCNFVEIKLHQAFNKHHSFEIKLDFEELDSLWMENPTKIIQLIGTDVTIQMIHLQTGDTNLFNGIVTNVSMNGKHGQQNYITIIGNSPTIKLEGTPTMDSFSDLTLDLIAHEAIENSGSGAEVTIKTKYKSTIDYIAQYNENCFQFLNRLSWLYGEWFFYDGTTCYFGQPSIDDAITITYDNEMTHFDLRATLIPSNVNRFEYLYHQDNETIGSTPYRVDGVRGYIKASLDQSDKVYTSGSTLPLNSSIRNRKDLDDLILVDKYRKVSQMLTIEGTTQTCNIKIGRLVSINLPNSMQTTLKHVETFLVTEVIHEINQDGTYSNTFRGIPSEMEYIPMQEAKAPTALSQIAWVTSNADAKGRIKVAFQWQKALNKTTNWLRVQTPDAGSSSEVPTNRGIVFIPEVDDLVMINFENGDPNRPYVSGSFFLENVSMGGGNSNHIKTIITRQGHTIEFDDAEDSLGITLKDKNGNIIHLDTKGKNIEITAPETITMKSKNMVIDIEENIKTTVGKNIETNVGEDVLLIAKGNIEQDSNKTTIISSSDNFKISTNKDLDLYGKNQLIAYTDGNTEFGAKNQMHMYGGNSLITAQNKIEQKAPNINEIPQSGEFIYDNEPQIVDIKWMNEDMTKEITHYEDGDVISLLVYTRNYEKDTPISIRVKKEDNSKMNENEDEIVFTGIVDNDGYARLKVEVVTKYI